MKNGKLLGVHKPVIGMIHVDALPGTPKYKGDVENIINRAVKEAMTYKNSGIDAIAIENMHDLPYLKINVGPEIISLMSIIGREVKKTSQLQCGIQILAGANKEALAAAHSAGMDFIRSEGFVFAHIADEGVMESDAGELLRYRKQIGAEDILIFTDIKKKHSSHSVTSDIDVVETAKAAEFFLSDGVILTGTSTGQETDIDELKKVGNVVNIPVLIGSGLTADNIENYFSAADAFIIGSYFKQGGYWQNEVDADRVEALMNKINKLR
ncbi:MAG: BtpA/SgcQ family protein [Bacteroidetes bacterium]|nr:BtpA/SgcQ family protein [Bacteroidota bacterium]